MLQNIVTKSASQSRRLLLSAARQPQICRNNFIRSFTSSTPVQNEESTAVKQDYTFQHDRSKQMFEKLSQLPIEEIHMLSELIMEKAGIELTEADRLGRSAVGGGGGAAAAVEEEKVEKTAFDVKLTGFDAKSKIKVIKEIRAITGLGLKEAKEMVEGAPKTIKKDIKMEEAEELKAKLEGVGATIEIE